MMAVKSIMRAVAHAAHERDLIGLKKTMDLIERK